MVKQGKKIKEPWLWSWTWQRPSSWSVSQWGAWATHFLFPSKILRVLCGYIEHQRRVQFEGCVAEPLQAITANLPGSKWSCLLLRVVLQDAPSEVTRIYPPLKLRVFVDDITALLIGKAKKVMKKLEEEVQKKASNCRSPRMERKERAR